MSVSRPNFIELCNRLTAEDEKAFEHLWQYLGLSIDWNTAVPSTPIGWLPPRPPVLSNSLR